MSDRLADLEARVATLEAEVARLRAHPAAPPPLPSASARPRSAAPPPSKPWALPDWSGEDVLSRVGIGLLLVGVVFLLKWSIDQGWLGPAVRVAGAGALGLALVGGGVALRPRRVVLGDVLAGGGLATLYGTVFAAALLYGFVGTGAALALAALVAAASYGLALRLGAPLLAVVGVLGGLGVAVVLYENPTSVRLALAFAVLVAAGGVAVWWKTGWRGLLAALVLGFWSALAVMRYKAGLLVGTERHVFQAVVVTGWALVGLVPLLRASAAPTGAWAHLPRLVRPRPLAVWTSAAGAFALTALLWHLSDAATALLALAGAAGYAALAARRTDDVAEGAALAAYGLAAVAAFAGLRGGLIPGVLVALGVATALAARHRAWTALARIADGGALAAAAWALAFFVGEGGRTPTAGGLFGAVLAVGALAYAALGMSRRPAAQRPAWPALFLLAGHVLVMAAAYYLLAWMPQGRAFVNGAWGLYAVALVTTGLRLRRADVRGLGLSTLALTVAKLLLLDIRGVPMAARVVIFMGLGALVLAVSYLAPQWLKGPDDAPPGPPLPGPPSPSDGPRNDASPADASG